MKRSLIVFLMLALMLVGCLASCGDDAKKVSTVTVLEDTLPEFTVGQAPDLSGIKAAITYEDGTAETVTADKLEITPPDTSKAGTATLKVTYGDVSVTVEVTVTDPSAAPSVESIKILKNTVKETVMVGEAYDVSLLQVEAHLSDGSKKLIPLDELEIILPDTSKAGTAVLTVKHGSLSDTLSVTVSAIEGLQIVAGTLAEQVYFGESYDTSLAKAIVSFTDGSKLTVLANELVFGSLDTSTKGTQKLSVSYGGFVIEYDVEVVGISSLKINSASVAQSVKVGATLDTSALSAKLTYENGHERTLYTSELLVGKIDTSSAGEVTLKVNYRGYESTLTVNVVGVKSLALVTGSISDEVLVGNELDVSAIRVSAEYTDGTSEIVTGDSLTVGRLDTSSAGAKKLSIIYLDGALNVDVTVCGVEGIRVDGISKVVVAGETLSLDNMKVYAVYSDSKKTEVLLTEGISTNIDELDFDVEGDKTLKVSYVGALGSFMTEIKISTEPPVLVGLEIRTYNRFVGVGRKYDGSNVSAIAYFGNDTSEIILEGLTVGELDSSNVGIAMLTVSYTDGDVTREATAEVEVLELVSISTSGLATEIDKGSELDLSKFSVIANYSNGITNITEVITDPAEISVTGFDKDTAGDQALTVTFASLTTTHNIKVKAVLSIKILAGTVAAQVRAGYTPDSSSLELEITYTDGSVNTVKASALDGVDISCDTTVAGSSVTYTVSYRGASDSMSIEVLTLSSISALNGTVPVSVTKDSQFPYAVIRLTTVYVDKNGKELIYLIGIDDPALALSDFSTATVGEKALVFSFMGMQTTVRIIVNGIESLAVVPGTVQTLLGVGQELDTTGIRIRVQYTDETYVYVDTTSPYLTVGSIDTSEAGTKILKIIFQDTELDVEITVRSVDVSQDNLIFGVSLPDSLVARDTYKNNFKDNTSEYFVGHLNPYIFYLNVLMLDENDEIVDVDGKTFPTLSEIYEVTESGETLLLGDALSAAVSFNSKENSYQFTAAAIGRTFKLVVRPDGNCVDPSTSSRSHTVCVVDAYNVYNAKQLNVLTNADDDLNGGSMEGHLSQLEAVNRFLGENGIERPAALHGIVLHGNIDIKLDDIPSEYVYEYKKDGVDKVGFYDHINVYNNVVNNNSPSFRFYGNYYSIFSYNLPCVVENGIANNDDPFSSTSLFRFRADPDTTYSQSFDHNAYNTVMRDVAFRDNDPNSNDQSASERHMRGIICLKLMTQVFDIVNVNIDAYTVSMVPEADNLTVNLNKVKFYNAWQGHLFVWNNNHVSEWLGMEGSAPFANYQPIKINITESLIAKCGGPVILSQSDNRDHKCNERSGADIVVDSKSELYSYVTGQEAWFVAVGQTAMAGQILAMNQLIELSAAQQGASARYTSTEKIVGVSTVNMIMVNMGVGTTFTLGEDYNGTYTQDGVKGLDMTANPMVDAYVTNTGGQAPVFQSSGGGTCFSDGKTGVFSFGESGPGAATSNCFEGDFITLYYLGMGILLEYYH